MSLHLRIDDDLKKEAQAIFQSLGLDLSTAVTMFLKQVTIRKGIPFSIADDEELTTDQQRLLLRTIYAAHPGQYAARRSMDRRILRSVEGGLRMRHRKEAESDGVGIASV